MLAKDGKLVADDQRKVAFAKSQIHVDAPTGKPVADLHSFTFRDGTTNYELAYARKDTILRLHFIDQVKGI